MAGKSQREVLAKYIPEATIQQCIEWLNKHRLQLTIKKSRSTKLGDFRPAHNSNPAKITVNGDLNQYSFFITLIHEIAHGVCWNLYKNKVKPHGNEWKTIYSEMLANFIGKSIFPEELEKYIIIHINKPTASSCSDLELLKALGKYDKNPVTYLEDLPFNAIFKLKTGRSFIKKEKKRKRFLCVEIESQRAFLVNPLAEVILKEE